MSQKVDVASMTQFWIVRNHLYFPYCLFNLHFKDLRFFSTKKSTTKNKQSAFHRTTSTHLWQSLPCFDLKIPPSSPWIFVQPLKVVMIQNTQAIPEVSSLLELPYHFIHMYNISNKNRWFRDAARHDSLEVLWKQGGDGWVFWSKKLSKNKFWNQEKL